MRRFVLSLLAVLALAGCSGAPTSTSGEPATASPSGTPTDSPTPTAALTETPYPTTTPDPYPSNYWDQRELVVTVRTVNTSSTRNYTAMAQQAAAYWTRHSEQYAGYPITISVRENAAPPDIIIDIRDDIARCANETATEVLVGCAKLSREYYQPVPPEPMHIEAGYTRESTVLAMKHEFGHLLGLAHGEEPMPVMAAESANLTRLSSLDISERDYPWRDRNLSVYLEEDSVENYMVERRVKDQFEHAVGYYKAGKAGVKPENVSLTITNDASETDIIVRLNDSLDDNTPSDFTSYGYDIDTDSRLEYRSEFVIKIADIDEEATGWHMGYWLAVALGVTEEEDLPDPFRDAGYRERRSEWWE